MKKCKVNFIGHSAIQIQGSKTILFDPFIKDNPQAAFKLGEIEKNDIILVTHDHVDHVGDALRLIKRDKATFIAIHELAKKSEVDIDKHKSSIKSVGMNIGGTYEEQGVKISMTLAIHSSNLGRPVGYVVELDGKRFYHAGDTALFSDMKLIPKIFGKIDVAFVPIGGHYTMDERQAAMAIKMIKPKLAVPIHYNTWPIIKAETKKFINMSKPIKVKILKPGEHFVL